MMMMYRYSIMQHPQHQHVWSRPHRPSHASLQLLISLALVVSTLVPTSMALPLPGHARKAGRDGLIMGKDFLSLFMPPSPPTSTSLPEARTEDSTPTTSSSSSTPPLEVESTTTEEVTTLLETTTTSPPPTTMQDEVTDPATPTKVISVRVSSSVSEAPLSKPASPSIFSTFEEAFSKTSKDTKDVTLVTDNETPSAVQRSDLSAEEATPSSGPVARSLPVYGAKLSSNRFRPRTLGVYARPRPARVYSSPQSASEPIEVRLSPTATYSVVRYGRTQVRPNAVLPPPPPPPPPPSPSIAKSYTDTASYEVPQAQETETRELNYQQQRYSEPEKNYAQPEKIYGQPEKVYGEPEKVYGQPEKNYGQPEQNYGQPEKNYGQPEQNYGRQQQNFGTPEQNYGKPEQNYEVPESVNVESRGRVQSTSASPEGLQVFDKDLDAQRAAAANQKFGYVVEGRNYRKYRVEERTPDGFIVGEYGVVNHNDGVLRGVRYTADGTINPKLIYEALMKFLTLQ